MPLIAIDLTPNDDICWTLDDGSFGISTSLGVLARSLPGPHAVACRADFYAGDRRELKLLREMIAAHGHILIGIRPGALAILAEAAGEPPPFDDTAALARIVRLGSAAIDHRITAGCDWHDVRDALDVAHAAAIAGGIESGAGRAAAVLGRYELLDAPWKLALGNGTGYCEPLLDAVWRAGAAATSRDMFGRFLTLTNAPIAGQLARTVRGWRHERTVHPDGAPGDVDLTWAAYRRALRWAYSRIHSGRMVANGALPTAA